MMAIIQESVTNSFSFGGGGGGGGGGGLDLLHDASISLLFSFLLALAVAFGEMLELIDRKSTLDESPDFRCVRVSEAKKST
jgi:hypothetical protein